MEFCPRCGSLLVMRTSKFGCPRCNYISKNKVELKITEEMKNTSQVAVVKGNQKSTDPVTDFKCEKCKNGKSYFWVQQMRSGDEPESKFYKCTKCENTVRVDD